MPGLGEVGAPGSASFVVSQGNAGTAAFSTEEIVLIAGAAVLAAMVLAAVVAVAVRRRKRSTSAVIELESQSVSHAPGSMAPPKVVVVV